MEQVERQINWDKLKAEITSTWSEVTDEDVDRGIGDLQHLIATIKWKTGENIEDIEEKLERMIAGSAGS